MKPIEYTESIIRLLGDIRKQCQDQRFGKLLCNLGIDNDSYHMEYEEVVERMIEGAKLIGININPSEYLLWGTLSKDVKGEYDYVYICNMSSDHISNILKDGLGNEFYESVFKDELDSRNNTDTQLFEKDESYDKLYKYISDYILNNYNGFSLLDDDEEEEEEEEEEIEDSKEEEYDDILMNEYKFKSMLVDSLINTLYELETITNINIVKAVIRNTIDRYHLDTMINNEKI